MGGFAGFKLEVENVCHSRHIQIGARDSLLSLVGTKWDYTVLQGFATFFNVLGQILFNQAEIDNDRIPVHAYINVVYYAYFEKTGTGN